MYAGVSEGKDTEGKDTIREEVRLSDSSTQHALMCTDTSMMNKIWPFDIIYT